MSRTFEVVIVGAGIGGLTAAIACCQQGLDVLVLERAPEILRIGAGIQIPPNASRVWEKLGILPTLKETGKATTLESISFVRYKDGKTICERPGGEHMLRQFGAPWMVIHRADYHQILWDESRRLGAQIRTGCDVVKVDFENTQVILANGETVKADVIVGADGLWSTVRDAVLERESPPIATGDLAYRATLSRDQLQGLKDSRIDKLLGQDAVTVWLGPDAHVVFYRLSGGSEYNLVLLRPDNLPAHVRTASGEVEEMRDFFQGWDDILTTIISLVPSTLKWKLCHHDELENWTKGNVVLLGDACHPTLPYQAQGAAMAVEDGAVLGSLLGHLLRSGLPDPLNYIPDMLRLYESERKARTTTNVKGPPINSPSILFRTRLPAPSQPTTYLLLTICVCPVVTSRSLFTTCLSSSSRDSNFRPK